MSKDAGIIRHRINRREFVSTCDNLSCSLRYTRLCHNPRSRADCGLFQDTGYILHDTLPHTLGIQMSRNRSEKSYSVHGSQMLTFQ